MCDLFPFEDEGPAYHRLLAARSELKGVGRLWAKAPDPPCAVQELVHAVPACAVASPRHGQPGLIFLQPLVSKEEHEPQKDKKSRFCCYGQCYHIAPF